MPRRPTTEQLTEELFATREPVVREAFLRAIDEIRSSVTLKSVVEALERGDIEGALRALQIEPEAFSAFDRAITETYLDGGEAYTSNLPAITAPDGSRVVWRFGARNLIAEIWLREYSSTLITRISEDMKAAARDILANGLARGDNPTTTALDLVGRISRVSNRREGGILGLTAPQAKAVENARQKLLSGDPALMREVLGLGRRDKRFDRTIAKAVRDGKTLPADFVKRWTGRYADSLLKLRGDLVGLKETMTALAKSRHDSIGQQIAAGKIDARDVTIGWKHSRQENPRIQHLAMNGKEISWGERFVMPDGTVMAYPHDPDAPIEHTAFCKCMSFYRVNYAASLRRQSRSQAA